MSIFPRLISASVSAALLASAAPASAAPHAMSCLSAWQATTQNLAILFASEATLAATGQGFKELEKERLS